MVKKEKVKIVFLAFCFILILSVSQASVIAPDGGLGSAFGSGAANGEIQNAMQAVGQVLQLITQIVGNLKTTLESNAQAENTRLGKINAPRLPEDPGDQQLPEVKGVEANENRMEVNFTGMEITLSDRNTGNKLIVMNRPNVVGRINTNSSLENTITSNTTTIVTKNGQDLGVVRVGNETTLIDDGGAKLDSVTETNSNNVIIKGFLPLVGAVGLDSGVKEFSEQYVLFIDDDVLLNGHNILFFPLKPFDVIMVNGSRLHLMEKNVDIIFNEEKTYFSRKVGESNVLINRIINENDKDVYFSLLSGGSDGNYFVDGKKRLTVGDAVIQNPMEGYENVAIPRARLEMWKKAAISV